jgi:hypothetical protein
MIEGMIQETMTFEYRICGSRNIVRNGTNRYGKAQYHCKDCDTYRVLKPKSAYWETDKQTVLREFDAIPIVVYRYCAETDNLVLGKERYQSIG